MEIEVDGAALHVEVDGDEAKPALLLWPPGRCTVRVLECVGHNGILEHPELALDTFLEFHDTLGT